MSSEKQIPDGICPKCKSTEDWTKLGIRRLLQKAVQGNYDTVTFSPGQIQVDRWSEQGLKDYYDNIIPKMAKSPNANPSCNVTLSSSTQSKNTVKLIRK